jgi:subtilisin family serine protease
MYRKSFQFVFLLALLLLIAMSVPAFGQTNADSVDIASSADRDAPPPLNENTEAQPSPVLGTDSATAIPDRYIVIFKKGVGRAAESTVIDSVEALGGTIHFTYSSALNGFAATIPSDALETVRSNTTIAYIEADQYVRLSDTQQNATWGLDRIDQRDLPLSTTYTYNYTGAGVRVYIIDTGIRRTHSQFGGRALHGYTAINDGNGSNDCNGHGTHVAGTVGGSTYGVAKSVTLYAVRVLNCSGSGSNSGVIAGVDWVTQNHVDPAVANMSLGGGASSALDTAVNNSINAGVTYAIAAGNSNANACNYSPARVAAAVTVGSTTSTDARSSFSNYGTCLDIFAPGSSITSAWHTSDSATNTISGTSMASPHVAGAAALYLDENPGASPTTVRNALVNNATLNHVSNPGSGSPNRLLYTLTGGSPPPPNPTPTPTPPPGGDPCTNCEHYVGSLSGSGDYDYHPNGTYYQSGAGNHQGWLEGPSGTDFDLFLWRWNGWTWVTVAQSISSSTLGFW